MPSNLASQHSLSRRDSLQKTKTNLIAVPVPRCSSLSSSPLSSVPWIPHPQLVPLGAGGTQGLPGASRAQVPCLGGLLGDVLEAGWWWALGGTL